MVHLRPESANEGGHYLTLLVWYCHLPACEAAHVGLLLRRCGQILRPKKLRAHPDGHQLFVHSHSSMSIDENYQKNTAMAEKLSSFRYRSTMTELWGFSRPSFIAQE